MTEKAAYNALNIVTHSDYHKLQKLKKKYVSWTDAWKHWNRESDQSIDPEREFRKLQTLRISLLLLEDDDYPSLLRETTFPPLGLYVRGQLPEFQNTLAIIGTRRATNEGKELATEFGYELARSGCPIISGLALGIDSAAHRGTLRGHGIAVAVLANGLDQIYPATNTMLGEQITESNGALVSEYPLGNPPLPYRFLERNRIVTGLAQGILIIEAPRRSGTLASARFALEENREVFVIPGPVHHPNFSASHELIRQGATLVTKPEDIQEAFGISPKNEVEQFDISLEEANLLGFLRLAPHPLSIDKIIEITHLQAPVANQLVSLLLMRGLVKETETGYATIEDTHDQDNETGYRGIANKSQNYRQVFG